MTSRGFLARPLRAAGATLVLLAAPAPCLPEAPPASAAAIAALRAEAASLDARVEAGPELAQALEGVAARAADLGDPEATHLAEELLRRALDVRERAVGPAHFSLVPALERLSTLYYDAGDWARCEALDRRAIALRIAEQGEGHTDVAQARRNLALGLYRLNRFEEAEALLRSAAGALELLEPRPAELLADTLGLLAENLRAQGRYREAEPLFTRALALGPADPSTLLNNLAGFYRDQNRYAEALWRLSQALALEEGRTPPLSGELVQVWNNMAELYRFQGDLREAERYYRKAVASGREVFGPSHPRFGTMLNQLAELLREAGRTGEAEPLYREALAVKTASLGPTHPDVAHTHEGLGRLLAAAGHDAEAEVELRLCLEIRGSRLGPHHPDTATARLALAELLDREPGRREEARGLLDTAIADLESSPAEGRARARALVFRARLRRRAGDRSGAREDLSRGLAMVEGLRPEAGGGVRTRARFAAGHTGDFARLASWLVEDGDVEGAFAVVERARARALLDELAAGHVDLKSGIEPAARAALEQREARLLSQLSAARQGLWRLDASPESEASATERRALEAQVDAQEAEYQRLHEDILNSSRLWRGLSGGGEPAGLRETQAAVVPRAGLLLSYLVDDDQVLLFVVPPAGRAEVVPLVVPDDAARELGVTAGPLSAAKLARVLAPESGGPAEPGGLLGRLGRPPVAGRSRPAVERLLHGLWRVLVPEAVWDRVRACAEVVLVPDQVLHRLPFEALVVSRGKDGPRYWLDEGPPVRYGASATALKALGDRPRPSVNRRLVSVADPAYRPGGAGGEPGKEHRPSLESLPGTAREAQAVRAAFGAEGLGSLVTSLEGADAREPRVREALLSGRYLHLATHGLVDETRAELFASLALASPPGEAQPEDDGLLQLHEIHELRLDAELAVLSACESRTGEVLAGEGAFALSRAFLSAGSRRVVASFWPADDDATASLFAGFFRQVARGEATKGTIDYSGALTRAKREIRGRLEWADPFFWAAFVIEGAR
jgi:tetratricopeptide (TPR) repeat protein